MAGREGRLTRSRLIHQHVASNSTDGTHGTDGTYVRFISPMCPISPIRGIPLIHQTIGDDVVAAMPLSDLLQTKTGSQRCSHASIDVKELSVHERRGIAA